MPPTVAHVMFSERADCVIRYDGAAAVADVLISKLHTKKLAIHRQDDRALSQLPSTMPIVERWFRRCSLTIRGNSEVTLGGNCRCLVSSTSIDVTVLVINVSNTQALVYQRCGLGFHGCVSATFTTVACISNREPIHRPFVAHRLQP